MKNSNYNNAVEKVRQYHDEKQDKILYEWNVDPVKWKEAMKPIEEVYKKDFKRQLSLGVLLPLGVFILGLIFDYVEDGYLDHPFLLLLVPLPIMISITFIETKRLYKNLYKHDKYVFFITNKGVYNGWHYCRHICKYKISDDNEKLSLYITQSAVHPFAYKLGAPVSVSVWNDFPYTEKDKASIFRVLFQWEKEMEGLRAASSHDRLILHEYIDELEKNNASRRNEK